MDSERTKKDIVNAALIELGLPPSFSTDDTTQIGSIIQVQWPRAIARCFGLHDWFWCRRTSRLTRLSEAPTTGFSYQFQLPGDMLGAPLRVSASADCRHPVRNFRLEAGTLHSDCPEIWLRCKVKLDPRDWDDQFADCFAVALASMLAVPVKQDEDLAYSLSAKAFGSPQERMTGGLFGRLISQMRAGEPVGDGLYAEDPLTAAHDGAWAGRFA
ncbi:MAG: hypothetical protein ACRCU5_13860 [Rhizobiaceae bacterium]